MLFPSLEKLIEAANREVRMIALECINVLLLDLSLLAVLNDILDRLCLLQGLVELREKMRVEKDGLCTGLLHRVLQANLP